MKNFRTGITTTLAKARKECVCPSPPGGATAALPKISSCPYFHGYVNYPRPQGAELVIEPKSTTIGRLTTARPK